MEVTEYAPEPGVIETLWAEGEDAAVLDAADVDLGDGADGGGAEIEDAAGQEAEGQQQDEKVDGRRGSKEYREALKAFRSQNAADPKLVSFANTAQADHFRVNELNEIEPGGVSALREKYALLESVGGAEAITQMQERIAETDAVDAALAAGDPKALDALGPDFNPGLAKLTPAILERVMQSDPEAYAAAILPHLMHGLQGSLVPELNRMIDVLGAPHLDEKGKLQALTQVLAKISQWFEYQEQRAGQLKTQPADRERGQFDQERTQFEREQQEAHWNNRIAPEVATYERSKLEELYKPYESRLKLDAAAKADLFDSFRAKMKAAGQGDAAYMKQMGIYRKQRNPDPAVVANFVKSAVNRHAKNVVEGVIKARYGRFLGAPAKKTTTTQQGARTTTTGGAAPTIVSAKPTPDEIDYRKTSEAEQWKGIYTLKTGKRVKWVKQG